MMLTYKFISMMLMHDGRMQYHAVSHVRSQSPRDASCTWQSSPTTGTWGDRTLFSLKVREYRCEGAAHGRSVKLGAMHACALIRYG